MAEALRKIEYQAPAKINILLKVLGRRTDGFHEIYSIMQAIDLSDEISFTRTATGGVRIDCDDPGIPTGQTNTMARAFSIMNKTYALAGGLGIKLTKRIPPGSGLGGGSSDCACAIRAISALFDLTLTVDEMARLGSEIGSDVPFFFGTGSAEVRGRGEIVDHIDLPLDYRVILVVPNVPVSTRDVYNNFKIGLTNSNIDDRFLVSKNIRTLADLSGLAYNDLEVAAGRCCPEIRDARELLVSRGFRHVSMSGSGSAVFALMPHSGAEEYERITGFDWGSWRTFIARPIRLAKG